MHYFGGCRRRGEVGEGGLLVEGALKNVYERVERCEIVARDGRGDGLLDAVVARDEGRIDGTHPGRALGGRNAVRR